uniref:SP-RING-type domain-containing protein n=1 Tax=Solanum lycopersicum TaxID=4081 RepID=A0A3Q7J059_SOLLC
MQWQCPICLKNYSLEHVIIDPYFNRITSQMRSCGEDVTEIEVKPDGSWRAKTESDRRSLGDLGRWHLPDGSLSESPDIESKPKPEILKQVKQEGGSDGNGLKVGLKKNRDGLWEISKPEDQTFSSGNRLRENFGQDVIPMSSSATGSGKEGEDRSVNQDGNGNLEFSNNAFDLEAISLNIDPPYGFGNGNPSIPAGDAEVIVLSDSDEENEPIIPSGAVFNNNHSDAPVVSFPAQPLGIPDSFHDSALVNGGNSCLGLFNSNDDEFGMNLWSLPSGTQGGPGFQLFSSDADVSGSLVDVQHESINCTSSMSGYGLGAESGIGSASLLPETYTDRPNADINDSLVDNPLGFSGNDPSLQIFLPTRPSITSVEAARDQPDVSNGVGTEDWISLRLGGDGGVPGDTAVANGLSSGQQVQTKDTALDSLADTGSDAPVCAASLLIGMNDSRSTKSSRERSDSPFTFPRQRRSVRPRLYLSIDSDSE